MPTKNDRPSTKFTREEILAYAEVGVRERARAIEREIARMQAQFPEILIAAPVALLKVERRTDGQTWQKLPTPTPPKRKARTWTKAQRKAQAARMRKQRKAGKLRRGKQRRDGGAIWERMQAALQAAPDQRATSKELQAALGTTSVGIANSYHEHDDIFRRVAQGVYALTAAGKKASENGATA